jgi:uncharacterized linocin/CFP29 family protein
MAKELKTRFEISADELEHRMKLHQEVTLDPGQKAVRILEAAIDKVLTKLGVDVTDPETIPAQQEALGIIITENTDERTPQINGFFIFAQKGKDLIPYAWVGAARLEHDGRCYCDIQYFMDNRLDETGGIKIIQ